METAIIGGVLFGMLIGFVVTLLVGGLILKFSVKLLEKFSPSYGKCVLTVLLVGIASFAVSFVMSMVFGLGAAGMGASADPAAAMASMGAATMLSSLVTLVITFLLLATGVNLLIKHPDGRAIGFGRACLVSLLYVVIFMVLGFIVGIVLAVFFGAAMMGMAGAVA